MTPQRVQPGQNAPTTTSIIEAISILDDKLTAQIAGVVTGLQQLTEAHHAAVLEQERRNATFATAARLDAVETRLSTIQSEFAARGQHIHSLDSTQTQLAQSLATLQSSANAHQIQGLTATATWLVQAILILSSTVLGFILYHAVFH